MNLLFVLPSIFSRNISTNQYLRSGFLLDEHFSFLDPDLQKYADPRIRIHSAKYQRRTVKRKLLLSKPKSELLVLKLNYLCWDIAIELGTYQTKPTFRPPSAIQVRFNMCPKQIQFKRLTLKWISSNHKQCFMYRRDNRNLVKNGGGLNLFLIFLKGTEPPRKP